MDEEVRDGNMYDDSVVRSDFVIVGADVVLRFRPREVARALIEELTLDAVIQMTALIFYFRCIHNEKRTFRIASTKFARSPIYTALYAPQRPLLRA
jgi:hypothetical protein